MTSVLFVNDAWYPQVKVVVRTLEYTARELGLRGIRVELVTPQDFRTVPCPTYPDVRLSFTTRRRLIDHFDCEYLHIATERPLGLLADAAAQKWAGASRPATTPGSPNRSWPGFP
jgi:hypothetical protein